jgi:orotidine-5'-phosphate decarboxylase
MVKSASDHIVFPLDVSRPDTARSLVQLLANDVGMFKIGLELFIRTGPELVRTIGRTGRAGVFLDLKLHDIPVTVARAMRQVARLGVRFATVHCGESPAMLEAAVEGAGGRVQVLGVTVLTSVSPADLAAAGYREPYSTDAGKLVMKRAAMAKAAGCAGVVCSGHEVDAIKREYGGGFQAVTPGIRPHSGRVANDDQSRIVTPAMAIARGADYLVIGRPIRDAADPLAAARSIAAEVERAMRSAPPPDAENRSRPPISPKGERQQCGAKQQDDTDLVG